MKLENRELQECLNYLTVDGKRNKTWTEDCIRKILGRVTRENDITKVFKIRTIEALNIFATWVR